MRVFPFRGLIVLATVISLTGAGCWKKKTELEPAAYTSPTSTAAAKKTTPPTEEEVRNDLRTALQNFKNAKSFRANVALKTSEGEFKAKMDFAKPNRIRGAIDLRPGTKIDMIVVEDSLYMRFNDDPWANISEIPSAGSIANAMKESLTGQTSLGNLGIGDSLVVKRTADRTRKCDLYRTTLTDVDGKAYEVEICVANGLPKILEIKSATNPLKIEYYDYNAVFLIERPTR